MTLTATASEFQSASYSDFRFSESQYFQSELLPLKRSTVDFTPIDFKQKDCDSFSDSLRNSVPGSLSLVYYLRGEASFRVPFDSETLQNVPFEFSTCGQSSRMTISVDDSAVECDNSLVFFDSDTQEFVFVGYQSPTLGTYDILVTATIRSGAQYLTSSFTFELAVVDQLPVEETDSEAAAEEEESICLQSHV